MGALGWAKQKAAKSRRKGTFAAAQGRLPLLPFNLSPGGAGPWSTLFLSFASYMDQKLVTRPELETALRLTCVNAVIWMIIYIFLSLCESAVVAHRNQQ